MYMKGQQPLILRSTGSELHIRISKSEILYVYEKTSTLLGEEELHIRITKSKILYVSDHLPHNPVRIMHIYHL